MEFAVNTPSSRDLSSAAPRWRRVADLAMVPCLRSRSHSAAAGADAAMYKWVDEKGVTHYTDKLPPDAVNKANTELNKQGVVVKKTDPPVAPEVRKAREADAEKQRELAKEQADLARRDRALLDSYTTESDIDLAKNRSIKTIDQALQSAQAYSARLTKRREDLLATKAALGTKPVPATLERELTSTEAELGRPAGVHRAQEAGTGDGDRAV
jgi:hypothetical protein